jgi:hypothetical protein
VRVLPLFPPPQLAASMMSIKNDSRLNPRARWRFPPTSKTDANRPAPSIHSAGQLNLRGNSLRAEAAVVVTAMDADVVVAVPFAVIELGVIAHVASRGRPAQASAIVPLNPVDVVTLTEETPVPPGAATVTVDCPIAAKNPAVMVNVCDVEVLALKLESPL